MSGFGDGLMQGIYAGDVLANRVAQFRSGHRMKAVQDAIDAGKYDPANFNGDSAAAQMQLQEDLRKAREPLSNRGLDDKFGDDQYDRIRHLQQLRANQRGGAQMNQGDLAGGMDTAGSEAGVLGNLQGAMAAKQTAGAMRAGAAATHNDGPNGTPKVNAAEYGQGVAANSAQFGDTADTGNWMARAHQDAAAAAQGALGRALTMIENPQLGGVEGAAPHLNTAAQLMGYGGVQFSPSEQALYVLNKSGDAVGKVDAKNAADLVNTIGRDPEAIVGHVQQLRDQDAQSRQQNTEWDRRTGVQARITAQERASEIELQKRLAAFNAELAHRYGSRGQPQLHSIMTQPMYDQAGNQIGERSVVLLPGTTSPVVVSIGNQTGAGNDNPLMGGQPMIQVHDMQGNPLPLGILGGEMGSPSAPTGGIMGPKAPGTGGGQAPAAATSDPRSWMMNNLPK